MATPSRITFQLKRWAFGSVVSNAADTRTHRQGAGPGAQGQGHKGGGTGAGKPHAGGGRGQAGGVGEGIGKHRSLD